MGRVKLQIKKLESAVGKQVTYSKRRTGLQKKAQELSILCDIDIVLILFSPAGKLSWTVGHKSSVEEVIMRFANLSPQERAKRKLEGLEQLKRVFNKLGDDVSVEEYMQQNNPSINIEELHQQLQAIHSHFTHLQQRLRSYENVNTVKEAEDLEKMLKGRLLKIHYQKQLLESSQQQVIPFSHGIGSQFYQSESLSSSTFLEGNLQCNWIPEHDQHNILALNKSNSTFPLRDASSNAVCSSSSGILHAGRHAECTEDQTTYNLFCQWNDASMGHPYDRQNSEAQKQQKLALDMDVTGCHASEFGSENTVSITNNVCSGNREPISWHPGPQTMTCDEVMNAHPRIYQLTQQGHMGSTEEAQSRLMHHQLEGLRSQNSSLTIQNHHGSHECSW